MKSVDALNDGLSSAIDDAIDQSEEAFALYGDKWSSQHALAHAPWRRGTEQSALVLAEFVASNKESVRQAKRLKWSLVKRRGNK